MSGKPIAAKGMLCPFFRKDVSKVCHKCELYKPVPVMRPRTGEEFEQWGCAFNNANLIARSLAASTDEAGAATESFRNVTDEFRKVTNRLCDVVAAEMTNVTRPMINIPQRPALPTENIDARDDQQG